MTLIFFYDFFLQEIFPWWDHQWRIPEFQNGGGGGAVPARSRRGRIFRSGVCCDTPSHILECVCSKSSD